MIAGRYLADSREVKSFGSAEAMDAGTFHPADAAPRQRE